MVRMYEENEVHHCNVCALILRVTFAAVPVEPLSCCGHDMKLVGIQEHNDGLDLSVAPVLSNARNEVYMSGEKYGCDICGIEVVILRQAQPVQSLDCCGEGMQLIA